MTPSTEAGRAMARGGVPLGMTREWFTDDILAIEAQAIDARVAALVAVVAQLNEALNIAYRHIDDEYQTPEDLGAKSVIKHALVTVGLMPPDLATLAAERDDRLRREGWDAALAAVESSGLAWPRADRRTLSIILDRLAAEGPR